MSRILVLGATGFIGRNMVSHFAAHGHEVHAVRFTRPEYKCDNVTWHQADLREQMTFDMTGYDIVIQAAATTSGSKDIVNTPAIHVTDNAIMNALIFRAAVEAKVKHVIFFSCSTMFSQGHVDEDSPIDIHPKYFGVAHTKLYNEKMCEFYAGLPSPDDSGYGTKFTVIRHGNIYGPHDKFDLEKSHFMGASITKVMTADESVQIWGSGEESRDLLYVSDLCSFVEAAIEKQVVKFRLYHCGYGIAFKIIDVVRTIIDASGKKLNITYDMSAPTIPVSLSMNFDKARGELGWWPKVTLDGGIAMTLEWWKEQKNEFL